MQILKSILVDTASTLSFINILPMQNSAAVTIKAIELQLLALTTPEIDKRHQVESNYQYIYISLFQVVDPASIPFLRQLY